MINTTTVPLQAFRLFETSGVDKARTEVTRVFSPYRLAVKSRQPLRAIHNRIDAGGYTLNSLQYGADVSIDIEQLGPFYMFQASLEGVARFRSGVEVVDLSLASAAILSPSARLAMDWSADSRHLILQFPVPAMQRSLEALLGKHVVKPLTCDLDFRIDGARDRVLKLMQLLHDDLDSGSGMMTSGIAGVQIRQAIIIAMLNYQPNTYSDALRLPQGGLASRQVRRAEDFMRQYLARPISLADIAAASGGSIRALHEAFAGSATPHRSEGFVNSAGKARIETFAPRDPRIP